MINNPMSLFLSFDIDIPTPANELQLHCHGIVSGEVYAVAVDHLTLA